MTFSGQALALVPYSSMLRLRHNKFDGLGEDVELSKWPPWWLGCACCIPHEETIHHGARHASSQHMSISLWSTAHLSHVTCQALQPGLPVPDAVGLSGNLERSRRNLGICIQTPDLSLCAAWCPPNQHAAAARPASAIAHAQPQVLPHHGVSTQGISILGLHHIETSSSPMSSGHLSAWSVSLWLLLRTMCAWVKRLRLLV